MTKVRSVYFAFVLHAHQPIANSDNVVQEVVKKAYYPVLKMLSEQPWFKFSLHCSGSLLDRLENLAPDLLEIMCDMVETGQMEMLGGAYHEALLPFIPSIDRRSQLTALRTRLSKRFGADIKGIWLAQRFWEPSLPTDLVDSQASFTLLDEHGFLQAGFDESQLTSHFMTEDQGNHVALFPISKGLRYLLPFAEVEQIQTAFQGRGALKPGSLWTFADDLEKFGAWPGTWEKVHEKKWFKDLLDMLSSNLDWINPVKLSKALEIIPSKGLAYCPASSYPEMMRWSLPPHLRSDNSRTGHVRNFLVRYPEINILHKRMISASKAVHHLPSPSRDLSDLLWQSQSSCAYWHGWFGGAYLPNLRLHARSMACKAETTALRRARKDLIYLDRTDFDLCGHDEIILSTHDQWLLIKPQGGGIIAWEDRRSGFDHVGCMNAWSEEGCPDQQPISPLLPFEDLILPIGPSIEAMIQGTWPTLCNLRTSSYEYSCENTGKALEVELKLNPAFSYSSGEEKLEISKKYSLPVSGKSLFVEARLTNPGEHPLEFAYGMRVPLSAFSPETPAPFTLGFPEVGLLELDGKSVGEVCGIQEVRWAQSKGQSLNIYIGRPSTVWYFPLAPEILIEGKPTNIFQGVVLAFILQLRLEPGTSSGLTFRFGNAKEEHNG